MTLPPEEIARTDFARVRKGYDPAAVDKHLQWLTLAVGANEDGATPPAASASLAGVAGEKVMSIIDLVERSAAEIVEEADKEAVKVVADATERMRGHLERAEAILEELAAETEAMRESAREIVAGSQSAKTATIDVGKVTEMLARQTDAGSGKQASEQGKQRDAA